MPNHLTCIHVELSSPKNRLSWYIATIMPPKGYPTTQFSMLEAEDLGLYELDTQSARNLVT
ncbi:MAG: hypothetical protein IPN61_10960 [Bacteroidetes bacterium]|nr:hypothetical protein [Bacteroidota bacterium]